MEDLLYLGEDRFEVLSRSPGESLFVFGDGVRAGESVGAQPVITIISPTLNSRIARATPLVFEVSCALGVELQRFNVRAHASLPWELGYRDGTAGLGYGVTRTDLSDDDGARFRFEVTRTAGWPVGAEISLEPFFGTAAALAAVNE